MTIIVLFTKPPTFALLASVAAEDGSIIDFPFGPESEEESKFPTVPSFASDCYIVVPEKTTIDQFMQMQGTFFYWKSGLYVIKTVVGYSIAFKAVNVWLAAVVDPTSIFYGKDVKASAAIIMTPIVSGYRLYISSLLDKALEKIGWPKGLPACN